MKCVFVLLSVRRGHLSEMRREGVGSVRWPEARARQRVIPEVEKGTVERPEGEVPCTGPWNWVVCHGLCPTEGNWGILNGQG